MAAAAAVATAVAAAAVVATAVAVAAAAVVPEGIVPLEARNREAALQAAAQVGFQGIGVRYKVQGLAISA